MKNNTPLDIEVFLEARREAVIFDVRTPAEFEKGHLIGAESFPLFSNEERAEVGTIYKQTSKEAAFLRGLDFVGPKMRKLVEGAKNRSNGKPILCYCWRGGQRSSSLAWLLGSADYPVFTLSGGYKSYRRHILKYINHSDFKYVVLSGSTGSGKTLILKELEEQGEQIIDLEGLANHKGSSFGGILEMAQPSNEHFENLLGEKMKLLDPGRRVWIENESRLIGAIHLQQGLWERKEKSNIIDIQIPLKDRLQHLENVYGEAPREQLKASFVRIGKRLGGSALKDAIEYVSNGELQAAANIALRYYDKSYNYQLENKKAANIFHLPLSHLEPAANAAALIEFAQANQL